MYAGLLGLSLLASCQFFKGKPGPELYLAEDLDSLERPGLPLPNSELVLLSLVEDSTMKSGYVQVRLIIDEYGKASSPTIVRSLAGREDALVLQRVRKLPDFIPGRVKGKPVKTVYFMAFIFNPHGSNSTGKR